MSKIKNGGLDQYYEV